VRRREVWLAHPSYHSAMPISGFDCPDCERRVAEEPVRTITGREVCPDCANALFLATGAGVVTSDPGSGAGVWAMLNRRIRRQRD
jgi:hypothetical protein